MATTSTLGSHGAPTGSAHARSHRSTLAAALFAVALLGAAPPPANEVRHPEDLFIVDCLLPGKVRSIGRIAKTVAPRQVIRTTAHECGVRGGEWSRDPNDNAFALQSWLTAAEGGDAEAMNNCGEIFEQGVRGTPDYAQAASWYRRAAEAGSRRAQTNLGVLTERGLGVAADQGAALALYRRAAGMTSPLELAAQAEIDGLRQQLTASQAEAAKTRDALSAVERDLAAARSDLADTQQQAAAATAAARQAQQAAQASKGPSTPTPGESGSSQATGTQPKAASQTTPTADAALAARQARVAELEAAQQRYRRLLGELEATAKAGTQLASVGANDLLAKAGPRIDLVRPDVLTTRGPALVQVSSGAREVEVVGRVVAPLGLAAFTVDGAAQSVDAAGIFHLTLPASRRDNVRLVAIDRASRRAEAELALVTPSTSAPTPTSTPVRVAPKPTGARTHALVIANAAYQSFPQLATAAADGEALAAVLRNQYGYSVQLVRNASLLDLMKALVALGAQVRSDDDVVVYFAGHGRLGEAGTGPGAAGTGAAGTGAAGTGAAGTGAAGTGYWLPVDARPDDPTTWISNEQLARHLERLAARRVLVIADSCYAGTLGGSDADRGGAANARTRLVLSSGGLAPVLDQGGDGTHSLFARALLSVLSLARQPLSAAALESAVAARVTYRAHELGVEQAPDLAPIRHAGHEAGDFVLTPVA